MKRERKAHMTGAALSITLLILAIQVYLFETVLSAVLDGQRGQLPGAFIVSFILTGVALYLAFKVPYLDKNPKFNSEEVPHDQETMGPK